MTQSSGHWLAQWENKFGASREPLVVPLRRYMQVPGRFQLSQNGDYADDSQA